MNGEIESVSRRRRRRADRADRSAGHHRWILSYADFITLLFAFFTALYGISTVDMAKFGTAVTTLHAAFGSSGRGDATAGDAATGDATTGDAAPATVSKEAPPMAEGPADAPATAPTSTGPAPVTLDDLRARLSDRLAGAVRDERVSVELDPRGLVVSLRESGSFATGSAEVSPRAREVVGEVAAAVREVGNFVRVEGHTDDVPIHTDRYASNWELSTARATNVVALLVGLHQLDPARLSAAGYSQFHPRVPNDSEANRARNRRVDVVILNPAVSRREEPDRAAGPPAGATP